MSRHLLVIFVDQLFYRYCCCCCRRVTLLCHQATTGRRTSSQTNITPSYSASTSHSDLKCWQPSHNTSTPSILLPCMHHVFSFDEEFKGVPFGKNIDNKCSVATDADVLMWMHARSGALNNFNCKVVTDTIILQTFYVGSFVSCRQVCDVRCGAQSNWLSHVSGKKHNKVRTHF